MPIFQEQSEASVLADRLWARFPGEWSTALAVALATLEEVS